MFILLTKIVIFTNYRKKNIFFKAFFWLCCAGHLGLQLTCSSVDAASCKSSQIEQFAFSND